MQYNNTPKYAACPTTAKALATITFVTATKVEVRMEVSGITQPVLKTTADKLAQILPKATFQALKQQGWDFRVGDKGKPQTIEVFPTVRRELTQALIAQDDADLRGKLQGGLSLGNFAF